MASQSAGKAAGGGLPLVFLGASVLAFVTTGAYIPGTVERIVAAIGVGVASSIGGSVGAFGGMIAGGASGGILGGVLGFLTRARGLAVGFAAAGAFAGALGGAGYGVYKGYDLSRDFMIANMGNQGAAVEAPAVQIPDATDLKVRFEEPEAVQPYSTKPTVKVVPTPPGV